MGSHGEFIIALVETLEPYNGSLRVNCDQSFSAWQQQNRAQKNCNFWMDEGLLMWLFSQKHN